VTVATNMAGRGVDIILGGNPQNKEEYEKIKKLGGLHVIGTERHEARRIDNQLRGRAGRQGDPGSSQFFISLEDELIRIFGGEKIKALMETLNIPEDHPIESKIVSKAIDEAQARVEGFNFDLRKHLLEYDSVLNLHRERVYKQRKEILELDPSRWRMKIIEILEKEGVKKEDFEKKEEEIGKERILEISKYLYLRILDSLWINHLENMEYLRDSISLRAYGQKEPLVEYKKEGNLMFKNFFETLNSTFVKAVISLKLEKRDNSFESKNFKKKIGRNEPCPCGSGKKYKKCCWPKYG